MRPHSIIMFERLFLASLAVGLLGFLVTYEEVIGIAANDPGMRELGLGTGFLVSLVLASYAVSLLLWFLIARRASSAAKWILVVFTVLGVLFSLPTLAGPWDLMLLLSVAIYGLQVAAVVYLFRADAKAWLAGTSAADPATFD